MNELDPAASGTGRPRAVVTGGTGFIGSHLCTELVARGYHVTAIDNLSTGPVENVEHLRGNPNFDLVVDDILTPRVMERHVAGADVVFHLAAVVGVQLVVEDALTTIRTNVLGTEAVLAAADEHGVKVMMASTSEVYGKCLTLPAAEDDDVLIGSSKNSRWSYATSKLVDEFLSLAYHRQRGLPVTTFRLFNTVGPMQTGRYGMVIPRFVSAALEGRPIPVHGDGAQSRSFCHVLDAIDGILRLTDEPAAVGRVFNIGGSVEVTIMDLARRVLELTDGMGVPGSAIELIPYDEAYAPGYEDIRRRVADTTRVRELTGWAPTRSLDDIIRDVAAATLAHGARATV